MVTIDEDVVGRQIVETPVVQMAGVVGLQSASKDNPP